MQTRYMKYMLEIAQTGSITKAANNLFLSRQALSKIVQQVESELGFPVFQRLNKGVIPTDPGSIYLNDVKIILSLVNNWNILSTDKPILIKIGVQYILNDSIMNIKLLSALNEHSNLEVEWEIASGNAILEKILVNNIHIGILLPSSTGTLNKKIHKIKAEKSLVVEELSKTKLCVILKSTDPLCNKEKIYLTDLKGKTIVRTKATTKSNAINTIEDITQTKGYVIPEAADVFGFVLKSENAFTISPTTNSKYNPYIQDGRLVARPIEDYLSREQKIYLLYNESNQVDKILLQSILEKIKKYY